MRYARLGVEEVEGAAIIYWHGVRRLHRSVCRECWLYLCAVRNGCSRRVIGWAICRRLDQASLQPAQAPLGPRHDQPGRIREQIHSDGTSRLTVCPPNGVKATRFQLAQSVYRAITGPTNLTSTLITTSDVSYAVLRLISCDCECENR
jgi:hypothetical protein